MTTPPEKNRHLQIPPHDVVSRVWPCLKHVQGLIKCECSYLQTNGVFPYVVLPRLCEVK